MPKESIIKHFSSSTTGNAPSSGDLVEGELAINTADEKVFFKNLAGNVLSLGQSKDISGAYAAKALPNTFTATQSFSAGFTANGATFTNDILLTKGDDVTLAVSDIKLGFGSGNVGDEFTPNRNIMLGTNQMPNNQSGNYNIAIGRLNFADNTSGSNNIAIGDLAGYGVSGSNNTTIGRDIMSGGVASDTATDDNTIVGNQAGYNNRGSRNTALGSQSFGGGGAAYTDNVAVGYWSLLSMDKGFGVVAIGSESGRHQSDGSSTLRGATGSIYIGYKVRANTDNEVNSIVIAGSNGSTVGIGDGSNSTVIGNPATVSTRVFGTLSTNGGLSANGGVTFGGNIALKGTISGATNIVNAVVVGGATLTGNVSLTAGSNITLTRSGNTITVASTASGGGGGVTTTAENTWTATQTFSGGINVSAGATFSGSVESSTGYRVGAGAINAQTAGYSLVVGDNGKIITMNSASAITLTAGTAVGTTGFSCSVVQLGAGQVTIAGSGVTLNSFSGLKIAGQHGTASIVCYATNTLNVAGNLTP